MSTITEAAVLREHKKRLICENVILSPPLPGQVLVRITASGVCHTDIHAIDGDWDFPTILPLIPGHEGIGTVEKIGLSVTNVNVGDRVGIAWLYSSCGGCEYCVSGREPYCTKQSNTGYTVNGCFSKYVLADANFLAVIPDELTDVNAAPILCAGVTAYTGVKNSGVKPGQFLTVIGAGGGLGHLAVQYATAMGIRVVGVDVGSDKLHLVRSLGAEFVVDGTSPTAVDDVLKYTSGGSHAVLCLAASISAVTSTLRMVRRGGTIILIGLPKGELAVNIVDLVLRGITLKGSLVGTREDLKEALDFAARGKVHAQIEVCYMSQLNTVLDRLRRGDVNGRFVLDLNQ